MRPRLTTIAIDSRETIAPVRWSADWVQHRLIEAYSVERRLPQPRRRALASAWPATAVEFQDLVGWADAAREQVWQAWEASNAGVSAEELTRAEEAQDWLRLILKPYPRERLCLALWATAIAYRRSLRSTLAKRRWARTTFYRYVTAGAHVIALELQRRGQPVA